MVVPADELQSIERDILAASLGKLRREAAERANLDDFDQPFFDDEASVCSEAYDVMSEGGAVDGRRRKRSQPLSRLDEEPEPATGAVRRATRAKPLTRRSISRELFSDSGPAPSTASSRRTPTSRPVARRSVSRELFDVGPPSTAMSPPPRKDTNAPDLDSIRRQMRERERSVGREFDRLRAEVHRDPFGGESSSLRSGNPAARFSGLASHGRSLTQAEFAPMSRLSAARRAPPPPPADLDDFESFSAASPSLERGDWRRVSVPERGGDYKSLPRKYNR